MGNNSSKDPTNENSYYRPNNQHQKYLKAAREGDVESLSKCIAPTTSVLVGAIYWPKWSCNCVIMAAMNEQYNVLQFFGKQKILWSSCDSYGGNALHYACAYNKHRECIEYLLDKMNKSCKNKLNKYNKTPLDRLIVENHACVNKNSIISYMRDKGCKRACEMNM